MSLATTAGGMGGVGAGGAGAGGLIMAHQANAVGVPPGGPQQHHNRTNASSSGAAPPPSSAALGADLIDKNQTGLTMKQVRNRQHLPIVGIDLYAADGKAGVAFFPKKPEDPSKGAPPLYVSHINTDLQFLADNETAHKTLRKYLSKSKTFASLLENSIAPDASATLIPSNKKDKTSEVTNAIVIIKKPHHWMGLRRICDAPESLRNATGVYSSDNNENIAANSLSHVIAEESSADVGVSVENSTLDGVSCPNNDDFDRVVIKVRLHNSKKAITILPEEAVQIVFCTAQHLVASKIINDSDAISKQNNSKALKSSDGIDEEDEIYDYPISVALPAWAMHDSANEAFMDATEGAGVFFPRSVAAAAGILLPSLDGSITPILSRINIVRNGLQKRHQKMLVDNPDAVFDDAMLMLFFGMTDIGMECTAIQISSANMNNISCLFSEFKVLSNTSFLDKNPISVMEKCSKDLEVAIDAVAPESDGPSAIVFYGGSEEQELMKKKWEQIKNKQEEWKNVPTFVSPTDSVARGTAVMGAVAHGRLTKVSIGKNSSGKKKVKSHLGIRVQNVALAAVGISFNYHGDEKENADKQWTPIKTIFDFDRQTPAGPHSLDLKAAECAAHKEKGRDVTEAMSDEEFLKLVAQYEGAKGIPSREDAALNLRVQVYEKWTRDGVWMRVGDPMEPLVMRTTKEGSKDGEETRTACEAVILDLSLSVTGLIITSLVGERTSVVVATKEARNSRIRWYLGMLFIILFCGGFLFKSWYDDYVLERDTKRLLAFYHHVVPGSIHDGDVHNARYTCYKFRNKKAKLWKRLETKYGEPVLNAHEYLAMTSDANETNANLLKDQVDEELDLDAEEDSGTGGTENSGDDEL